MDVIQPTAESKNSAKEREQLVAEPVAASGPVTVRPITQTLNEAANLAQVVGRYRGVIDQLMILDGGLPLTPPDNYEPEMESLAGRAAALSAESAHAWWVLPICAVRLLRIWWTRPAGPPREAGSTLRTFSTHSVIEPVLPLVIEASGPAGSHLR